MPLQMRRTSASQSDTLKLPRFISGNLSEIEGPVGPAPWGNIQSKASRKRCKAADQTARINAEKAGASEPMRSPLSAFICKRRSLFRLRQGFFVCYICSLSAFTGIGYFIQIR